MINKFDSLLLWVVLRLGLVGCGLFRCLAVPEVLLSEQSQRH